MGEKRGIWNQVGKRMGKDGKWAGKHYLNSFSRAAHTDEFTAEDKIYIDEYVDEHYTYTADEEANAEQKKTIVAALTKYFAD